MNRAGGVIIKGKKHWWTNWFADELTVGEGMCLIADYTLDVDLLQDFFDNKISAYLLPIPVVWRKN